MKEKGLNRNQLKYLVIVAMLIDHIAWAFVPTASAAGMILHFFGRLTGPVMAFFLAEGFYYTRNLKKYAVRMGVFALISWIPFSLFETGRWPTAEFGVIYTLFLGLLTLIVLYRTKLPPQIRVLIAAGLFLLSRFGDWAYFDILWPVVFYRYHDDEKKKWLFFSVIGIFVCIPGRGPHWWIYLCNLGIYMVPFLLHFCYNGKPGSRHPFHKWFFYVFYPAHLFALFALKRILL